MLAKIFLLGCIETVEKGVVKDLVCLALTDAIMSQVTPISVHLFEIPAMVLIQNIKMFLLDGSYDTELNLDFSMVHGLLQDAEVLRMVLHVFERWIKGYLSLE